MCNIPNKKNTWIFSLKASFPSALQISHGFLLCLGLNLLRPTEVYPHALADEERGQSHIDIPKGPKRRRICQVARGHGWEGIVISVKKLTGFPVYVYNAAIDAFCLRKQCYRFIHICF